LLATASPAVTRSNSISDDSPSPESGPISPELENRIREALNEPGRTDGVRKIADRFGVNPGTVQRISRPFEASVGVLGGASVGA
jgi:hypothetical protein